MAVSAKFLADFSSFYQAVEKAELTLSGFRSSAAQVEKSLQRMGDSFSGKKILSEATLAVKAVENLGGVSKLTSDEQRRLNGIVTDAIAKYKALGQSAPKDMIAVADATKPVVGGFSSILNALKSIGPAIGITFSVGAVIGFAKSLGEFAGQMLDLQAETQISTRRLQAFDIIGGDVSLTVQDIAGAADQLAKRLGGDDKSVNAALEKLHLDGTKLKTLSLDQVMFEIDRALGGVNNQFDRARILADLFGKTGAQLGRIMDGSLRQAVEALEKTRAVIDDTLLTRADKIADNWGRAWKRMRAEAIIAISDVGTAIGNFIESKWSLLTPLGLASRATGALGRLFGPSGQAGAPITPMASHAATGIAESARDLVNGSGIPELDTALAQAREQTEALNKAYQKLNSDVANERGLFLMNQDLAILNASTSQATQNLQRMAEGIERTTKAAALAGGTGGLGNLSRTAGLIFGPPDISGANQNLTGGLPVLGIGQSIIRSLQASFRGFPDLLKQALVGGGDWSGFGQALGADLGGGITSSLFGAGGALSSITSKIGNFFGSSGIGQAIGGALGSILPGIGSLVGPAVQGLGKLFGKLFDSEGKKVNDLRDQFIASAGGIDKLAEAARQAGTSVDALLRAKKVTDFDKAVSDLQARLGQFASDQEADQQRLTAAVEKYGFTFEQLGPALQKQNLDAQAKELIEDWRVLVAAGVDLGTVNEKMASTINDYLAAAIKTGTEVPNALRPILQKMAEQGLLTDEAGNAITDLEASGIKFSETMTEGFDKVVKKLDELIERLGLAGTEMDHVLSKQASASGFTFGDRMGIPTGEATKVPGFARGTGGRFVDFGAGTLAMLHGREAVVTQGEAATSAADAELRALRGDFNYFTSILPYALRDAVLRAR